MFAGIPFGKDEPYTYLNAKRLLGLAMDELRMREDLRCELGMNPKEKGRSAITGRDSNAIWDFLRLTDSNEAENFTEFPHLTFSVKQEQLQAQVTIPNGIRPKFRRNLLANGCEGFRELFYEVLREFESRLGTVEGAVPWVEMLQRRYPAQRAEPLVNARLEFDLRTGFDGAWVPEVKQQPQWLRAAFDSFSDKNSNLQIGVGGVFPYDRCPATRTRDILDHVASAWLACKPLIKRLLA